MKNIPPLKAIKTFEAAARNLSFSKAANELHVTQSAVSHQIKSLELFVDKQLFVRKNHRVYLTQEGDIYYRAVKDTFLTLSKATRNVMGLHKVTLKIVAQSSFATEWLAQNLSGFTSQNTDIDVSLTLACSANDHKPQEFDISIGTWPSPADFDGIRLRDEKWYPVIPSQLFKTSRLLEPSDLLSHNLVSSENRHDWELWTQKYGLNLSQSQGISHVSHTLLAAKTALNGSSIALSCDFITNNMTKTGQLIALKEWSYELPWGHYSVHYRSLGNKQLYVQRFVSWISKTIKTEPEIGGGKQLVIDSL